MRRRRTLRRETSSSFYRPFHHRLLLSPGSAASFLLWILRKLERARPRSSFDLKHLIFWCFSFRLFQTVALETGSLALLLVEILQISWMAAVINQPLLAVSFYRA